METKEDDTWYTLAGPEDDIILSTRARLARNLADFPFVTKMTEDDRIRVNSLVYDVLSRDESFNYIESNNISTPGLDILNDKCVITDHSFQAVSMSKSESISILVNEKDHIRISNFVAGLDCEKAMERVYKVDEFLQQKLQFAASYEFGYLTSHIKDSGTGLKFSFRCFIPSIILANRMPDIVDYLRKNHFNMHAVFKSDEPSGDFANTIFEIENSCAAKGTELDQLAAMQAAGMYILKTERKIRSEYADNNPTSVLNYVKQALAKGGYAMLLSYEEGINIVAAVKWGLGIGLLTGIEQKDLNALFYRTKHGHLKYLCDNYSFAFENDVKADEDLQIKRLRTIVIQQALENLKFKD